LQPAIKFHIQERVKGMEMKNVLQYIVVLQKGKANEKSKEHCQTENIQRLKRYLIRKECSIKNFAFKLSSLQPIIKCHIQERGQGIEMKNIFFFFINFIFFR
jgi:flagellar biosynthesis component FlhA